MKAGMTMLPLAVLGFALLVVAGSVPAGVLADRLAAAGMLLLAVVAVAMMRGSLRRRSQPPDWDKELTLAKLRVGMRARSQRKENWL